MLKSSGKVMKRKFKIVVVQVLDGRIILGLKPLETAESKIRPEEIIEELPSSEEERIALKLSKAMVSGMVGAMRGLPGMPLPPSTPIIRLELTEDEYKHIGSPSVYQSVILEFNIKVE